MFLRKTRLFLALSLALALHGCSSDPDEPDDAVGASDAGAGDAGAVAAPAPDTGASTGATGGVGCTDNISPTPASVATVFERSCGLSKSCHAGDNAQQGLNLSTLDSVFATAVGKAAKQAPEAMLIVPGDPANSYLMRKILGMQTMGTSMPPPPAVALCDAKVKAIEGWIRAGAMR